MTREEAFDLLGSLGAATAVVRYSGGGDEGGVDEIEILDANDHVIADLMDHEMPDMEQEAADDLAEALEAPVDEQHGGFDGAGIYGQLTWVVAERTIVDRPAYEEYVQYGPHEV